MIRNLLVIAGAALVLCAVTLGGAAALGGRELQANHWNWGIWEDQGDGSWRMGSDDRDLGPPTSRRLAWDGNDTLILTLPGEITFVQGDEAGIVVEGPKGLADRVMIENGRLFLDDGENRPWDGHDLIVVVTAPSVTRFRLEGAQDLTLQNYNQPELSIDISGSGEVDGTGQTETLSVAISGSGEVSLGDLRATQASVAISGSGDARIAPLTSASINISGSGDVSLATRPATVTSAITGSGDVSQD